MGQQWEYHFPFWARCERFMQANLRILKAVWRGDFEKGGTADKSKWGKDAAGQFFV